jgi:hypothetical protein
MLASAPGQGRVEVRIEAVRRQVLCVCSPEGALGEALQDGDLWVRRMEASAPEVDKARIALRGSERRLHQFRPAAQAIQDREDALGNGERVAREKSKFLRKWNICDRGWFHAVVGVLHGWLLTEDPPPALTATLATQLEALVAGYFRRS